VHQTYISFAKLEESPSLRHWLSASGRWRTREPRLRYTFHSDADLRQLVADHYPWFLPTYDAYPRSIQRVDAARYFLLHHHGGLYADLDIEPSRMKGAIGGVIQDAQPGQALLNPALGAGVSNDLMAAPPAHPLFLGAILHLHCHSAPPPLLPPMFSVLWSAGSLFLTAAVDRLPGPVAARDVAIDGRLYAYVRHLEGNSWHTPDAALLLGLFSLRCEAWLSLAAVVAAASLWHCGPRRWRRGLWRQLAVLGFDVDRRP
jgi:mannosyltransferase OCH1-like enzyme